MQHITCFEVYGNTDITEGRGPMKVAARFSEFEEAKKYVESREYAEWCIIDDDIKNIKESIIVIFDSVDELNLLKKEQIRSRALSKLTNEEREALGL